MEQKKILWIVAAVSVFVLVIFGFALVIYSPSKTSETERQTASAFTPGSAAAAARQNITSGENASTVDPDSWVKNPEYTPGLDTEIAAAPSSERLTDINAVYGGGIARGETEESRNTINVRDLTSRSSSDERLQQRQIVSADASGGDASAAQSEISKTQETVRASEKENASEESKTQTIAKAQSPQTQRNETRAASSGPEKKSVVEYWIQTGSFSNKLNAENARKMLTERYLNAEIFTKELNGTQTYRVRVGPYADKEEADYWLGTISERPEFSGSYVSRVSAQR